MNRTRVRASVRRSVANVLLGVMLASGVTTSTGRAHADDTEAEQGRKEAESFFEDGVRLAKAGDNAGALAAFREAYARFPSYRVLYNIGQLCARIGDAACAVRSYEGYLRDGRKEVPAKRRKELEAEIRALSRTVGRLTVTANADGADVMVDDEHVGQTPLPDAIAVNGGSHKVVALLGDARAEANVTVVSGGAASVALELEEKAPPPPPAETAADPEPASAPEAAPVAAAPRVSAVPWIVTGGLAAVTAVTGILAAGAWSDFKETRDTYPISRGDLESAHGSARDLFLVATAFGVATLVSAGVATYFTLGGRAPDAASEKKSARAPTRRIALVPTVGGLVLIGGLP